MSGKFRAHRWLMLVLLIAVAGCELPSVEITAEKPRRSRRSREQRGVTDASLLSIEDGQRFALRLLEAVDARDTHTLNELIDWDSIVAIAGHGCDIPREAHQEVVRGVKSATGAGKGIFCDIVEALDCGGSYCLLRVHVEQDAIGVWCRLKLADGRAEYHDFRLHRLSNGVVLAKDVYTTTSGATIGELMQPFLADFAQYSARGLVGKLTSSPKFAVELKKLVALENSGNHTEAVKHYRELPEELRRNKLLFMRYLISATHVSPEEAAQAMEDAGQLNLDGSLDALMIDHYAVRGKYREAIACVDRLNRMVGGDIYLSRTRIKLLVALGELGAARSLASSMIQWAPDEVCGYSLAIEIALHSADFDTVASLLDAVQTRGLAMPDVEATPLFADFVQSEQYQEYLRKQQVIELPEVADLPEESAVETDYSAWPRQL